MALGAPGTMLRCGDRIDLCQVVNCSWMRTAEDEDDEDNVDDDDDDDDDVDDDDDDDDDDDIVEEEKHGSSSRSDAGDEGVRKDGKPAGGGEGDEYKYMTTPKGVDKSAFYCAEIVTQGLPKGRGCPTQEDLFAGLNCQSGFWVPRSKLEEDLEQLRDSGIFKEVDVKVRSRRCISWSLPSATRCQLRVKVA
jgi:hypothetical protein